MKKSILTCGCFKIFILLDFAIMQSILIQDSAYQTLHFINYKLIFIHTFYSKFLNAINITKYIYTIIAGRK
jgi:hypothetical protein